MWKSIACLVLLVLFSSVLSFTDSTYRIYDENWRTKEYWRKKGDTIEVYNKDWSRKGYIKKERGRWEIYDKDWKKDVNIIFKSENRKTP